MCDVLKNKQLWRKQTCGKAGRRDAFNGHKTKLPPQMSNSQDSFSPSTDNSNPQTSSTEVLQYDCIGKHVHFGNCVRVLLIPSRHEYIDAGLAPLMWWEDKEFSDFKKQAFQELLDYINNHPGIGAKEAFDCMYRSTTDYEGKVIWLSLDSFSSLSTISCSDVEVHDIGDDIVSGGPDASGGGWDSIEVIGEQAIHPFNNSGDSSQMVGSSVVECCFHDVVDSTDSSDDVRTDDAWISKRHAVEKVNVPMIRASKGSGDEYLRSLLSESSIWYDLELMRLQTQRIVLLQGTGESHSDEIGTAALPSTIDEPQQMNDSVDLTVDIAKAIDARSQKGPDFMMSAMAVSVVTLYTLVVLTISHHTALLNEAAALLPILWSTAYIINVVAVSVPGRLDRMYSDGAHIKPWQSLFEPSSWAFAIWGVIYLAELLVTVYLCVFYKSVLSEFGIHGFKSALPYWTAGNCLQALWCFVFRPEFKSRLWIPSCCLLLSSLSLLVAYSHLSSCGIICFLIKLPLALHATWLFCLTMIVLNSWLTLSGAFRRLGWLATVVALSSSVAAMLGGAILSVYSSDISFALTCAWALDALASRSMDKSKLLYKSSAGMDISQAEILKALSIIETIMSTLLKFISVYITITVQLLGVIAPVHR